MLVISPARWHAGRMVDQKRKNRRKNFIAVLLSPVVFYTLLRWFEQAQVYQPYTAWAATGDALGRAWEDVYFTTRDDVKLNGWFFPADRSSPRSRLAVLFAHGNGGNISHRLESYSALLETGVNLFAFDYRGYGRSAGRPREEGTYLDAQAAYAWLLTRGFAASNLVAFGESLGGAVAAELSARETAGGLILQSTFTSVPDIGAEIFPWLPVRALGTIKYDTRRKLPRLKIPVLIMHSRADSIIPFHHGERNFAAANEPKRFLEITGDHNDGLGASRRQFVEAVENFLKLVESSPASQSKPASSPGRK